MRTSTKRPLGARDHVPPAIHRPVQLSLEVAAYVRELILSGQVKTGEALSIDRLARDLDVSTTPVREGLMALHGEGFVRFEPRRGFRVSELSRQDIKDLYWIQSDIAGELGARAVARRSDELLRRLMELQKGMRSSLAHGRAGEVATLNHMFHRTISQAAESPKLAWLLGVVVRYAPRRFHSMIPGWVEASLDDHEAIIDALRSGDAKAARKAMTEHILHAGGLLLENLERRHFWSSEGRAFPDAGAPTGAGRRPAPASRGR